MQKKDRPNNPKGTTKGVEYLPIVKFRDTCLPSWAGVHDRFFVVEICGDSLTGANISNGDHALVHITKDFRQGDLVSIFAPCGVLIKFFYTEESVEGVRVRLESANAEFEPRYYDVAEVKLQGKVIRIERD